MDKDLQLAIAQAEMEVAEKRLALLLAQGGLPAQSVAQVNGAPASGDAEWLIPQGELGNIEDGMQGSEPGEAITRESQDDAHATEVPQSTRNPSIAEEDANPLPPVTIIQDEPTHVLNDATGGAETDESADDARSAAALDENDEVESLVRDDDTDVDADVTSVTVKTETDKAETSAAPTNNDMEDGMSVGAFMDRVFRWGGLVWSDSSTRKGVNAEAATQMATELVGFEVVTFDQVGQRAPLDIKSARQWASKSRLAAKVYTSVPEANYTMLVAQAWRGIRQLPYQEALKMNGRYGLIGVIRAIYQANTIDPDACEDFRAMMLDAAEALRAMRATVMAARDAQLMTAPAPITSTSSTLLDVLIQRDADQAVRATEAIKRLVSGDIIEIDDEEEERASVPRKGGSGGEGGKPTRVPAKRKPTSTPVPSPRQKKNRS
ncbi:unnamed protein product [Peniophora sp. CBMAI 1063]|nr:unnamed protein product [Peniophora sp. CBMAI 1063]